MRQAYNEIASPICSPTTSPINRSRVRPSAGRTNAARASEHRGLLTRDAALDRLARAHTEGMAKARIVGHDIGGGDVATRLAAAGIHDRVSGENCANASSTEGAHRALWSSPSHRSNLLLDQFTRVGVSVIKGSDGIVWVTEMFGG